MFRGRRERVPHRADFAIAHRLANILCLPYQPLSELSGSLSAADLHIVVMGAPLVGIVHTCKIYNIMCVGSAVLYIGPSKSHVMDIAAGNGIPLYAAEHGDVDKVVNRILARVQVNLPSRPMLERGRHFLQEELVPRFANMIESLCEETPATSAVPNVPGGRAATSVAAAGIGAERTYSAGD